MTADAARLATFIAEVADGAHGRDVLMLEVGEVTVVAKFFVLVSAPNRRLVRRLVEEIEVRVGERFDEKPLRVEGISENEWVAVDYGDVIAHVFLDEIRDFYEIERLYSDVPMTKFATPDRDEPDDAR